ncbi:MAG: phosphoribosylglycinamide formyltransferase [Deltaproteobacteria bacterium]
MKRLAVLASGNGTNLQAIIDNIRKGALRGARVVLVVSDREKARALRRAAAAGIPASFEDPRKFPGRAAYDGHLVKVLRKARVDYVVLAGFMRILSPVFVRAFKNRVLNIHPALLPAFRGTDSIARAHRYGVRVTGVTVHFVDEKTDNGPVILQEAVAVRDTDSVAALEARIHRVEHRLYTQALQKLAAGRLRVRGRRVLTR